RLEPVSSRALVVAEAAHPALFALEKVADDVLQKNVTTADPLGEEAPLLNLVLALLVDLDGEALRPDLLAVPGPALVEVAHPPDARARGAFENAPRAPIVSASAAVGACHASCPRQPARRGEHQVRVRSPERWRPGDRSLPVLLESRPAAGDRYVPRPRSG